MEKYQLETLGASAEEYIKAHLSEKLDRDTLCRVLSTNRTTLSRALILRTGRTLRRFILDERIRASKKLLLSGKENISEIAEMCGFIDASYFSRVFREQTGMTPALYVKTEKEQNDTVQRYNLDGDALPFLPWLHDCAISHIEADDHYLFLYFDNSISAYTNISNIRPGAKSLCIRYHLCDPCISIYRRVRNKKSDGDGVEIGYLMYDDNEGFYKESLNLKLFYLYHCIEYNTVILKLWSKDDPYEVMLDFNANLIEYEWGFNSQDNNLIDRMKSAGVRFECGMSEEELIKAERHFGFTFPKEIWDFLRLGVPTEEGFFDYKDLSERNTEKFKKFRRFVENGFAFDVQNVPRFLRKMEMRYGCCGTHQTLDHIMAEYEKNPKLIPFYKHRCFFDGLDNMPIISYSQPCDMIIYGENFQEYLKREFCKENTPFTTQNTRFLKNIGIWESCLRTEPHIAAHDHCSENRNELNNSQKCGCFYCLNIFPSNKTQQWIDNGKTALCSFCGIDSVIGDASGYSITKEFLKAMHDYWFSPVEDDK